MASALLLGLLLVAPVLPVLVLAGFASWWERCQGRLLTRRAARVWLRVGGDPELVAEWKRAGKPSAYDLAGWTRAGLSERWVVTWQVAGWCS